MFKFLILVLGLGIGFGSGVFYSVHHPDDAANLAAQEQASFLKAQADITQATKSKLDQLINRQHQTGDSSTTSPSVDPDLQDLQQKAQKQLNDLHARLNKLGNN
jgi:hypothetical protein